MNSTLMYILISIGIIIVLTSAPILVKGFYKTKYNQKYTEYFRCQFADEIARKSINKEILDEIAVKLNEGEK